MNRDYVDAVVYLQIEPERGWGDSPQAVIGAHVVTATQRRSRRPRSGVVEVALTVRLPKAAFDPVQPEAVIVITQEMLANTVDVTPLERVETP